LAILLLIWFFVCDVKVPLTLVEALVTLTIISYHAVCGVSRLPFCHPNSQRAHQPLSQATCQPKPHVSARINSVTFNWAQTSVV